MADTAPVRTLAVLGEGSEAVLELHPEVDSTNTRMRDRFADDGERFAQFSAIATTSQTAGRGRLDREWVAPAGSSLALSVYIELAADLAPRVLGWVSLIGGVAVCAAIEELAPEAAALLRVKWPNDVLLDGRKVCGVLGELLGVADGGARFACALGIGVNTALAADELPTDTSTSLALAGIDAGTDALAIAIVREVARRVEALIAADGDALASGLHEELTARCSTLGVDVRVSRPDGSVLDGTATGLDASGALLVAAGGAEHLVNAGDIEHVRPQAGAWTA